MPKLDQVLTRFCLIPALMMLSLNVLSSSPAGAWSSKATFSLGPTGLGLENGNLLVATRLNNTGEKNALKVKIDHIRLYAADRITPVKLPVLLGEIDAGQSTVIQASFSSVRLKQGEEYWLQVRGTYRLAGKAGDKDHGYWYGAKDDGGLSSGKNQDREFDLSTGIVLPPTAPGSAALQSSTAGSQTVAGGGFPHIPLPQDFDEANEAVPPIPTGPFIAVTPTPTGTAPQPDPGDPSVAFNANDPLDLISGGFNGEASTTAEPSGGANGGGSIFATANWTAAYSTNGGGSFTQLDPTTIFPNDAVGYCCDQVVQYVPGIDRFIWLLQGNGYRIASASPANVKSSGGTAWTYWNLTPAFFGLTGSLDYPDVSVGAHYLYLSFDEVGTGLMVARISLAQLQAGGTITVEWTDPKNGGPAYGGHVMQDTGNEAFWAGHNSTSQMRIFSLAEGSTTYFWRDVNIGSWSNTGLSSTSPDGIDFLTKLRNFPDNAVIGATRAPGPSSTSNELFSDGLWFAWSAGTDSNFAQPHIEMVTLDRSNNFAVAQQVQIWNSTYAYVYPALATNACTSEVGFSIEGGGDGNYENHLVGFWGDFVAYITTNSNIGTTRFGDYVTLRQDPTPDLHGAFFDAFGYGLDKPSAGQTGTQTDVRYVQFGRAGACQERPPG